MRTIGEFDHWRLFGNASPNFKHQLISERLDSLSIGFNRKYKPRAPFDLIVANGHHLGESKTINVTSRFHSERLSEDFLIKARTLESYFEAWPSLGSVVLFSGLDMGVRISPTNMNLLPEIARSKKLASSTPLPACYHNWLAERRAALCYCKTIDWPELHLLVNQECLEGAKQPVSRELLNLAGELPQLVRDKGGEVIDKLLRVSSVEWVCALRLASMSDVKAIDRLFVLSRNEKATLNWWLYDYQYSIKMNTIRFQLAVAQEWLIIQESQVWI